MPKSFSRAKQVSAQIHRNVAHFIRKEMSDPRLGILTVSEVVVSSDLSYATIYLHILEEEKVSEILNILNKARGFVRSGLAKISSLRIMPKLEFCHDASTLSGLRIEALLAKNLTVREV